jgi:hypothetical protein
MHLKDCNIYINALEELLIYLILLTPLFSGKRILITAILYVTRHRFGFTDVFQHPALTLEMLKKNKLQRK